MVVKIRLYKAIIAVFFAIGLPAFAAGWVVAVNFSGVFETGYKMAFLDIESAMRESVKDRQPFFYMHGIKFYHEKKTEPDGPRGIKTVKRITGVPEEKIAGTLTIGWNTKN